MADEMQNNDMVVKAEGLVKVFTDFWRRPKVRAVDGIDLSIRKGELFGLLGPNGSGKSTTLKILLGLLRATGGTVRVLGKPPTDVRAKARIGYLPEESHLYQYLTPREALDFYGQLFGLDRATRRARTAELLEMVELSHEADRPVGEFSKGMARRVGLAQALINDPELVILDEPTSGLDPIGCRQVKDLMLALVKRGKTIILSSHLLADVEDVCDAIAILYQGQVRATGSVTQLLEKRDSVRFTVPTLAPEAMTQLLAALREAAGRDPEVDHPTLNLEQFFLKVVEDAGQTVSRPGIAKYLAND